MDEAKNATEAPLKRITIERTPDERWELIRERQENGERFVCKDLPEAWKTVMAAYDETGWPRPLGELPRCCNSDRYEPKDGPVLVHIHYFKRSGKWYTEDEAVIWEPDATHYTGWKPFAEIVRIREMFAICMETPLGFPQFATPTR